MVGKYHKKNTVSHRMVREIQVSASASCARAQPSPSPGVGLSPGVPALPDRREQLPQRPRGARSLKYLLFFTREFCQSSVPKL